ncbi:AAA family ATPase, partial [Vibrio parahaemolyticus]|uniref:AAA family ATPase n=1 Tax=Vibrio parahaemolyticus TaxID=670 RepID=UPI000FF11310
MRIKSISVKKLFGIFDHEILFNEDITILIGENGLGKTVILEMLNNIFKGRFHEVTEVSFDRFNITFENNVAWSFRVTNNQLQVRETTKSSNAWKDLHSSHSKYRTYKDRVKSIEFHSTSNFDRHVKRIKINPEDEIYEDFFFQEVFGKSRGKSKSNPHWFREIVGNIEIDLIETQRILTSYDDDNEKYRSTISDCAQNLQEKLKSYS